MSANPDECTPQEFKKKKVTLQTLLFFSLLMVLIRLCKNVHATARLCDRVRPLACRERARGRGWVMPVAGSSRRQFGCTSGICTEDDGRPPVVQAGSAEGRPKKTGKKKARSRVRNYHRRRIVSSDVWP